MVINLIRVSYGRDDTLANLREYKIEGTGPVGTIGEFKNNFPNTKFNVIDKRINKIEEVNEILNAIELEFNEILNAIKLEFKKDKRQSVVGMGLYTIHRIQKEMKERGVNNEV